MSATVFRGCVVVCLVAASGQARALATDVYYDDLTVYSPDQHYRLEAKSPANAPGYKGYRAFQRDFTYTLYDNRTGAVLWQREQAEMSPVAAWVDDARRVVIRTGVAQIVVLAPTDGAKTFQFGLFGQFTEEDQENVAETTAGPVWSSNSRWYFLYEPAKGTGKEPKSPRTYFVIRTWWDRRIIMDLDAPGVVRTPDSVDAEYLVTLSKERLSHLLERIDDTERAWVLTTLRGTGECDSADASGRKRGCETATAAHMAGRMKINEAIPLLREHESSTCLKGFSFTGRLTTQPYKVRQVAQLSLRRLGVVPGDFPCMEWNVGGNAPKRAERASRVHLVEEGMLLAALVDAIGNPDYSVTGDDGRGYEYDIDADPPYTLRVALGWIGDWDVKHLRVKKVIRIEPAAWKQGNRRERQLFTCW